MPPILHVALLEPEIPPNTGNIARSCAATGCPLHLIGKLGYRIDDASLRRAGIDYWEHVEVYRHECLADFEHWLAKSGGAIHFLSAHAAKVYSDIPFRAGDALLFGSESRGFPAEILEERKDQCYTIPMPGGKVRCLNLSTAAGIVLYEGLRQLHAW